MLPKAKSPNVANANISPLELSVLKSTDGTKPAATIALELALPVHQVESCFDSLRDAGLLEGWSAPPAAAASVSRRRALTDLGRAAALFGTAVGAMSLAGTTKSFAGSSQEAANKERKSKK